MALVQETEPVPQQYGGDREVASVAMLPPTCMVVWTGDAQQTPGGIAKGPSQIAITRRQLISRKHALRCPQAEYTPHTLFQALMKMVSHLDLPVVADLETMFQLAVTDLGPLWNPTEMSAHRECLDLLARVCPDCTLRWDEPTADDVARMPNNIEATIVGEEVNPTTLHLLAHICAALDSVPEWLQWVQAPDTLSAAGAAGDHSWGLMLHQHSYSRSQLHQFGGSEISSFEQGGERPVDCWYTLLRRT